LPLSPADRFNYVVGTQTIGAGYQFTQEPRLIETAEAIRDMGPSVIKFKLAGMPTPRAYDTLWEKHRLSIAQTASGDAEGIAGLMKKARLSSEDRTLVLTYYQGERRAKIDQRALLARERLISVNALRLRIWRLTSSLRECSTACMEMMGHAGFPRDLGRVLR
jgi:hypothetical protein